MKHLCASIIFLTSVTTLFISADETIPLRVAEADLVNINAHIADLKKKVGTENNSGIRDEIKKLETQRYDREREIHHWEMLAKLHSQKN